MKQSAATQRRGNAPRLLHNAKISFTEHNNGAHLILDTRLGFVDFWPGTGKWKTRETSSRTGYGLPNLFELLE